MVSRIVRVTLDCIVPDDDQVLIGLGDPPAPVPQPFAALLLDYAAHRSNMRTATNPGSTWLFPSRRAGQPRQSNTRPHQSGTPVEREPHRDQLAKVPRGWSGLISDDTPLR